MMAVLTLANLTMYARSNTIPKQLFRRPKNTNSGTYQVLTGMLAPHACPAVRTVLQAPGTEPCVSSSGTTTMHSSACPGSFWECMLAAGAWPGHCEQWTGCRQEKRRV
ncbi:hypothetical protein CVIRNUC_002189 [Coccomyxa viridis]|uniref:Secreted protein n=1 Tax=Coccomyxa viridis TaxID=1274662 RepID=A0AAV1HWY7_9CHLO|nr:hypothetical protein CVIRNUC_002189 [Coccomyxa viridis]